MHQGWGAGPRALWTQISALSRPGPVARTFKVLPAFLPVILPMLQGTQMLFQSLERVAPFPDPTGPVLDTKSSSRKFVQWVNRWINRPP